LGSVFQNNMQPRAYVSRIAFSVMTTIFKDLARGLVTSILIAVASSQVSAQTAPTNSPPASTNSVAKPVHKVRKNPAAPAEGTRYPFHGTVASVDAKAKTITLEGKKAPRKLEITSTTHLFREDKPTTLGSILPGDYAHGTVLKKGSAEQIVKGSFGLKPAKKAEGAEPEKKQ
jgi:hypothetical protein